MPGIRWQRARPPERENGLAVALVAALWLATGGGAVAFEADTVAFCAGPQQGELCAALPQDVPEFDPNFRYVFLSEVEQFPFDNFSWQSFVALNWPAGGDGEPLPVRFGERPEAPRVWQAFDAAVSLLGRGSAVCDEAAAQRGSALRVAGFIQASGHVLVDRKLNYVVYDTRVNEVAAGYLDDTGLLTRVGQMRHAAAGGVVDFPLGWYESNEQHTGGSPGAQTIKSSWRVLDPADEGAAARYFTLDGLIALAGEASVDGQPRCVPARLALVGMHIVQRTRTARGDRWIWSTFEHQDNAPLAGNARNLNVLVPPQRLFPEGCTAPDEVSREHAFYDPGCADCRINAIEPAAWKWAARMPFARGSVDAASQVVRCWGIFEGTAKLNRIWHERLPDGVWRNYFLVGTQWMGNDGGGLQGIGETPRFLTNTTIETYLQSSLDGSCLTCHNRATTSAGTSANFSFLLGQAR